MSTFQNFRDFHPGFLNSKIPFLKCFTDVYFWREEPDSNASGAALWAAALPDPSSGCGGDRSSVPRFPLRDLLTVMREPECFQKIVGKT